MDEKHDNFRFPLSDISRNLGVTPGFVLVVVTLEDGQVVFSDLREYDEALALYDGARRIEKKQTPGEV
jgi:hypothetical protein